MRPHRLTVLVEFEVLEEDESGALAALVEYLRTFAQAAEADPDPAFLQQIVGVDIEMARGGVGTRTRVWPGPQVAFPDHRNLSAPENDT